MDSDVSPRSMRRSFSQPSPLDASPVRDLGVFNLKPETRDLFPPVADVYFFPFSADFAQESRRVAVRLNTRFPGAESTESAQKYPVLSN